MQTNIHRRLFMAEKYLARYGKVWKDRRTNKIIGTEIELGKGESIKSYTQVDAQKTEEKATKKEKSTTYFEGGN